MEFEPKVIKCKTKEDLNSLLYLKLPTDPLLWIKVPHGDTESHMGSFLFELFEKGEALWKSTLLLRLIWLHEIIRIKVSFSLQHIYLLFFFFFLFLGQVMSHPYMFLAEQQVRFAYHNSKSFCWFFKKSRYVQRQVDALPHSFTFIQTIWWFTVSFIHNVIKLL